MNRGMQDHAASHNYLRKGLKMQRALSKYPQHNCSKATVLPSFEGRLLYP